MHTLIRKLVLKLGGPEAVERRGPVFAYTGWGLVIAFGALGWWGGQFCAFITLVALGWHLLGRYSTAMIDG